MPNNRFQFLRCKLTRVGEVNLVVTVGAVYVDGVTILDSKPVKYGYRREFVIIRANVHNLNA
jgi:hypothetical protein